ncbi:GNAT family N-acetyltransferase [Isoptericola croceus]|uniref:GNAT family N-acetyltransferase n=1 Tax=Isoptericola croceus TaxID=3031406 RepID=UPI0023F7F8EF|nr:GNAT family N-acetyltransferase [Isoptericola croceus]
MIRLRSWREDDADAQLAAFNDPVFRQFSDWAPSDRQGIVNRIRAVHRQREQGTGINWAIVETAAVDVLGEVSLNGIDHEHGRASMGYWLASAARGRGVATRAVRLVAGWAFSDLELSRLELTCGPDNVASQRVAERCGFRREGLLRSHLSFQGRRRDSLVYGLLPGELTR